MAGQGSWQGSSGWNDSGWSTSAGGSQPSQPEPPGPSISWDSGAQVAKDWWERFPRLLFRPMRADLSDLDSEPTGLDNLHKYAPNCSGQRRLWSSAVETPGREVEQGSLKKSRLLGADGNPQDGG